MGGNFEKRKQRGGRFLEKLRKIPMKMRQGRRPGQAPIGITAKRWRPKTRVKSACIARHSRSGGAPMGHNKGKDNVKARKARRIKGERLQTAKDAAKASK